VAGVTTGCRTVGQRRPARTSSSRNPRNGFVARAAGPYIDQVIDGAAVMQPPVAALTLRARVFRSIWPVGRQPSPLRRRTPAERGRTGGR
jgi:hypothetical protein